MPRAKRQAPQSLGDTDPKVREQPEDLNPETVEEKPAPKKKPEPKPEPVPEVEVLTPEPEVAPEQIWKPLPSRTDEHLICEACELQARQVFKLTFRYRDPETGKVLYMETIDRLQLQQDKHTGEYSIISRM